MPDCAVRSFETIDRIEVKDFEGVETDHFQNFDPIFEAVGSVDSGTTDKIDFIIKTSMKTLHLIRSQDFFAICKS